MARLKLIVNGARKLSARCMLPILLGVMWITPAPAADPATDAKMEALVKDVATQLAEFCPMMDAGDQRAFDQCRQRLFSDSKFKQRLSPYTLWGRQRDPNALLKETKLTQFAPDVLAGLYAPLFMFDGTYKVAFSERENMYVATLGVAFRNRLQPGQFPYPFWHEADKWNMYENAKTMVLYIDPENAKTRVAQFSPRGDRPDQPSSLKAAVPEFDGKWLWTDRYGKTQPAVTLFDGLYRADNPFKEKLSQSYRELATTLRDGQCMNCHVPNNPNGMSKLVLLQTPAHAAAEIGRVMKVVRNDRMPIDKFGQEQAMDPTVKKVLLEKGGEFERVVEQARDWEKTQLASAKGLTEKAAVPVEKAAAEKPITDKPTTEKVPAPEKK